MPKICYSPPESPRTCRTEKGNILFKWQDNSYDTKDMIVVGGIPHTMGVYVTKDYSQVFAAHFYPDRGVVVDLVLKESLCLMAEVSSNEHIIKAAQQKQ